VTTTRPATAPEQKPSTLALRRVRYSSAAHVNEATAVASVVVVNALAATPSAATAEPALKPYQPTQSMPVPIMQSTRLCGGIGVLPKPRRGPTIKQRMSADQPEDMCTTVPPAKSIALMEAPAFHTPFIRPLDPHTMWASGKYTANIHSVMKRITAENFMRSAIAPTMSAGVIIANISWYIAKTFCETQAA
jgi:hypothetical protein